MSIRSRARVAQAPSPSRHLSASLIWLGGLTIVSIVVAMIAGAILYHQNRTATQIRAEALTGGDCRRGRDAMKRYSCGSCHVIPGVNGAVGKVGPDLTHVGQRVFIAGRYPNEPETMIRWLMHPQTLRPGSGMPELGVREGEARDMAACLYAAD